MAAYLPPALFFTGLYAGGWMTYGTVLFAFLLVPALEAMLPREATSFSTEEKASRLANVFFDILLYLNVPIVWFSVILFGFRISEFLYSPFELGGLVFSLGIVLGANGINVGHELGHRESWPERVMAGLLLLPSLYMHFTIEHNRGHHKYVGTPSDPATARYGESLYAFWLRSSIGGLFNAWTLERERLHQSGHHVLSLRNQMLLFLLFQIGYLIGIFSMFSAFAALLLVFAALISILLLESINYVEHYGLMRERRENERYERVKASHSWNSDHEMGRIILFELTRHSDHHFKANKKYQILEHQDESPQLPHGYPTSILLAIIPFFWRRIMHPRIAALSDRG